MMQSLLEAQYVQEDRDEYTLTYLLRQQGMLSTSGYKVLQGLEESGLIPCVRVIYDTWDKLDYDIENYHDLASLLSDMQANAFLHYAKETLSIILNLRNIGFLHACNLETTLDKIFIDLSTHTVHMINLPIDDAFLKFTDKNYLQTLKAELKNALEENGNLKDTSTNELHNLLSDKTATLEQLQASLAGIKPLVPKPVERPVSDTTSLEQTGDISQSGSLSSGNLSERISEEQAQPPAIQNDTEPKPQEENQKPLKKVRKKSKKALPQEPLYVDSGGTEVLSLFVPSIFLKGAGKEEFLIDCQEYILGRDQSVNGTVDATAISRRHCKITHSDGRNFVTDLGSANGTYLNGSKLEADKPRPLNEGDKIKLGNASFTVRTV